MTLTTREHQVLSLLCDGLTCKEIAHLLTVQRTTIAIHTKHIFTKLNVHSTNGAVAHAFRNGLVRVNGVTK